MQNITFISSAQELCLIHVHFTLSNKYNEIQNQLEKCWYKWFKCMTEEGENKLGNK
jgi:hypothetical protein